MESVQNTKTPIVSPVMTENRVDGEVSEPYMEVNYDSTGSTASTAEIADAASHTEEGSASVTAEEGSTVTAEDKVTSAVLGSGDAALPNTSIEMSHEASTSKVQTCECESLDLCIFYIFTTANYQTL